MRVRALRPMLATSASSLPAGTEWSYEVKWDGYRAQIVKADKSISLFSRNLKNITRQFSTVADAASKVSAKSAVIDGEIVALEATGRPSFQGLHHWSFEGLTIAFYAFDLLHRDGRDLTRTPLDERREALREVLKGSGLLLSEALPGTPEQIAQAVRRLGLEGVVAKRRRSAYTPGRRSDAWIKVRFARRQELIIGGFKPAGDTFDSVVVGYYDEDGKLMSAGKVRGGFTPLTRAELFSRLRPLVTKRCPFVNLPSSATSHWGEGITVEEMRTIHWVRPRVVAEFSFVEWTRDGSLRHASFLGVRDDKAPREVRREA